MTEYKNQNTLLKASQKFWLLYGTDEGRVKIIGDTLRTKANCETVRINAEDYEKQPDYLEQWLKSQTLFAESQLILLDLRDKKLKTESTKRLVAAIKDNKDSAHYLLILSQQLAKGTSLRKLFETDENCAVMPCYEMQSHEIATILDQELENQNIAIAADAKELFLQNAKGNMAKIYQEIEKLVLYKNSGEQVVIEDIRKLTRHREDTYISDLVYAVFSQQMQMMNSILNEQDVEPIPLILAMRRHIMLLNQIKSLAKEQKQGINMIIKQIKPPIFWKLQGMLATQAQKWSEAKLLKFYHKTLSLEEEVKTHPLAAVSITRMFLLEVAR